MMNTTGTKLPFHHNFNELFGNETSDQDQLVYAGTEIKACTEAIMGALDAHQSMSSKLLQDCLASFRQ
jgi:hypothetical protein